MLLNYFALVLLVIFGFGFRPDGTRMIAEDDLKYVVLRVDQVAAQKRRGYVVLMLIIVFVLFCLLELFMLCS